jgi:hypothetical protein
VAEALKEEVCSHRNFDGLASPVCPASLPRLGGQRAGVTGATIGTASEHPFPRHIPSPYTSRHYCGAFPLPAKCFELRSGKIMLRSGCVSTFN